MKLLGALLFSFFLSSPLASAQTEAAEVSTATNGEAKAEVPPGFQRVAGAKETDSVDASQLVFLAYLSFFVVIPGYLVWMFRTGRSLDTERRLLQEKLRDKN